MMFLFVVSIWLMIFFFFQAEDGIRDVAVTGVQTCALPISLQVLARQRERFRVAALTAHSNAELLERQVAEWKPGYVGIVNGGMREAGGGRSEERRVGKEGRSRWSPYH